MTIMIANDGRFGKDVVNRPFLINEFPIGFVSDVTKECVVCEIFDNYFIADQVCFNAFSEEQDIRAIGFKTPNYRRFSYDES